MIDNADSAGSAKHTFNEAIDNLTGYDELAIEKHFGKNVLALPVIMGMRAVHFAELARGGTKPAEAYRTVMSMRMADVTDLYGDEEDDPGEDLGDPITDAGKGEPLAG